MSFILTLTVSNVLVLYRLSPKVVSKQPEVSGTTEVLTVIFIILLM